MKYDEAGREKLFKYDKTRESLSPFIRKESQRGKLVLGKDEWIQFWICKVRTQWTTYRKMQSCDSERRFGVKLIPSLNIHV